jgi:hypothetical protein
MTTPTRMRRTATTGGRFRSTAARSRRTVPVGRLRRRQAPKPSTMQRIMGGKSGKAGGMALVAGAAGMLFKNRDKLMSRARGDRNAPPS